MIKRRSLFIAATSVFAAPRVLLVINLRTAKALGITIPQSVLLQASRVIE